MTRRARTAPTRLIVLVGASGSGKTAAARYLAERSEWAGPVHHFDDIGVPSLEEMETAFGGGEAWQKWATTEWIARLADRGDELALLEGQTRPSFILEALEGRDEIEVTIILLDCRPDVRRERLRQLPDRRDLADERMNRWAAYLVGQADALDLPVIDTSDLGLERVAAEIQRIVADGR